MDPRSWPSLTRKAVEEHGQPFQLAIKNALKEGRISNRTALEELRGIE